MHASKRHFKWFKNFRQYAFSKKTSASRKWWSEIYYRSFTQICWTGQWCIDELYVKQVNACLYVCQIIKSLHCKQVKKHRNRLCVPEEYGIVIMLFSVADVFHGILLLFFVLKNVSLHCLNVYLRYQIIPKSIIGLKT